MVCHIMFWIVAYEPIEFGIKDQYIYQYNKSCNIRI